MSPSTKRKAPKAKKAAKPRGTQTSAKARREQNERAIQRVTKSLDAAYADLGKLSGSVGAGVGDLRKDLTRLLRDARRSAEKMSKATRKDLEQLQKDLAAAAKGKTPAKAVAKSSRRPASKSSGRPASKSSGRAASKSSGRAATKAKARKAPAKAKATKAVAK